MVKKLPKQESKSKKSKTSQNKKFVLLVILLFLLMFVDISSFLYMTYQPSSEAPAPTSAKVVEIVDGDTFKIETGQFVRLIGVDAPEQGSNLYDQSTSMLSFLIANKTVKLEKDKDNTDNYGRLLRYVYVDYNKQLIFVNLEEVKQGYAVPMYVAPNDKYKSDIEAARQECLKNKLNLCG